MILAQALAEVRAQRAQRILPDGQAIWVSRVFPTSGATPAMPMASFVEQLAHTTIPTHFHAANQFQVVVEGQGTLGKSAVHPWTVHYTNGFAGYGPLCANAAGMAFFTLRNHWDAGGARYFPAGQSFMQPAPKRHHLVGPLVCSSVAALHSRQHTTCDSVLAQEEDGLAVWFLHLGPGMRTHAPDSAQGGGQYLLVAGGTLVHDGALWPRLSCLYISADTGPFVLQSGAEGLEILLLQFPVAEASATQPRTMSRTPGRATAPPWQAVRQAPGCQEAMGSPPWHTRSMWPWCSKGRLRSLPGVRRIRVSVCTWPRPIWPGPTCVVPICTGPGSLELF